MRLSLSYEFFFFATSSYPGASPSLSQQSSQRSGAEDVTPTIPPGEERPTHIRLSSRSSSSQLSKSEKEGKEEEQADLDSTLLDDIEINLDIDQPHRHFLLGPAQPILITKHRLQLRTQNTDLTEDARSFCEENVPEEEEQPTYL